MRIPIALVGAGGEPVDLWRTINSHGFADLAPLHLDEEARTLQMTVPLAGRKPRTMVVSAGGDGEATVEVRGRSPGKREAEALVAAVRHVLRMDEDLSDFYAIARDDPDLTWVARGAGRWLRSPTVFEDVVKTICTTNCAWSATERMVNALVSVLGEPAVGAADGPLGRAFPSSEAMANQDERFYREVVRAGYRGAYLRTIAEAVASGELDLEALGRAGADDTPDEELEARLLALPGVGPYASAHIMMTLGRYSRLILDSWTRPKYARLTGKRKVADKTIERRFRGYGRYAGLAFWTFVTSDW
jgi:N-glycosylase/DNA lyase